MIVVLPVLVPVATKEARPFVMDTVWEAAPMVSSRVPLTMVLALGASAVTLMLMV